jgi:hypothetical protein
MIEGGTDQFCCGSCVSPVSIRMPYVKSQPLTVFPLYVLNLSAVPDAVARSRFGWTPIP